MTTTLLHCEAVRNTLRQWQAEQEPVAAQLSESLAALSAYQSHLDDWQRQLARERDALRESREQLDQDRSVSDFNQSRVTELSAELTAARGEIATLTKSLLESAEETRNERQKIERNESTAGHHESRVTELTAEVNAARDKISSLTTMLLSRTEELRTLDVRRAEIGTELELARVRECELKAALEELRQAREWEHAQLADESRHLRELVERRLEGVEAEQSEERVERAQAAGRHEAKNGEPSLDNPVFASVMEQFGKLRQQRAMDRPASKKGKVN